MPYEIHESITSLIESYASYQLIALEITDESKALETLKVENDKPVALIVGNENFGISEAVLKQCNEVVHIDMYGKNSSMNVVQATSIALYAITNQLKS